MNHIHICFMNKVNFPVRSVQCSYYFKEKPTKCESGSLEGLRTTSVKRAKISRLLYGSHLKYLFYSDFAIAATVIHHLWKIQLPNYHDTINKIQPGDRRAAKSCTVLHIFGYENFSKIIIFLVIFCFLTLSMSTNSAGTILYLFPRILVLIIKMILCLPNATSFRWLRFPVVSKPWNY